MKKNYWILLGAMLSTSLLAQTNTTPAPVADAPAAAVMTDGTNAPAAKKKSGKKKSAKKPAPKKTDVAAAELKTVPMVAGPDMCVASNVNVRGQAKLKSEVVTHITKGQTVTVLEEVVRNDSGPEEPSAWAKILLPPGGHVWVNTMFIDATNHTVKPKKLNLRSGPGENYSVLGLVMQGDAVKEVNTKGDWTEIEPPASAYAFVAAQFLKQDGEMPAVVAAGNPTPVPPPATTAPPTPAPEAPLQPTTVAAGPAVAAPPTEPPATPATTAPPTPPPAAPTEPAPAPAPAIAEQPQPPAPEEPPPPRIVQREGIVRGMTSIQAPSAFVLINAENRKDMDYLYTTSPDLDLRRYKGLRIIVTGEEGLDERWPNTPVITIQKIQVVEDGSSSGS